MKKKKLVFALAWLFFLTVLTISPAAITWGLPNQSTESQSSKINYDYNIKYNIADNNGSISLYQESSEAVQVFSRSNSSTRVYVTNEDIEMMSRVVYRESRGEPYEGKVAVASVILNRALTPGFPTTIEGVITQKNAFSCVVDGRIDAKPDVASYEAVFEALQGKDPTSNAIFFYNPNTATSQWMRNTAKNNEITIGNHIFFGK